MIVGTAGHIDHGKTTLTRALTGVDTDRLKEEKERGISIELGYAYAPLENGDILGIIDVPGHEKFIRTMAAGVTGIDFALLVIAADDGVMPQTLEHLAILRLLGVRRGAVALTKTDRADAARIDQVTADIRALLAAADPAASPGPADAPDRPDLASADGLPSLADAPIFATNATAPNDAGVAALKTYLAQAAATLPARAGEDGRLFRLGVDRVFTLSGQGTIVAGTALSGQVRIGDTLQLAPGGQQARVRSIHAQNHPAEIGVAGQRLALNLAGIAREDIERGSWIVSPALAECSERLDVRLTLTDECGPTLKPWSPLHIHLGASHHTANIVLLEGDVLAPGHSALVQLVLDKPVHAVPGDRFVIRNAQATATIGGGVVLDPFGPARKRRSAARMAWLQALSQFVDSGDVAALLANSPLGLRMSTLQRLSQRPASHIILPPETVNVGLQGGDALLIAPTELQAQQARILEGLASFHERSPDDAGPELWRLKRMIAPEMEDRLWSRLIDLLLADGQIRQSGRSLHLPSHSVALSEQEQAQAGPLLAALEAGRYDPPWVRDLMREHGLAEDEVRRLLRKLAKSGVLSQIVPDLFYHPKPLAELAQIIATLPETQAASFRDATGLGRKRAIQILEFFDRVGYTRRVGNIHLVRPNAVWSYTATEGILIR